MYFYTVKICIALVAVKIESSYAQIWKKYFKSILCLVSTTIYSDGYGSDNYGHDYNNHDNGGYFDIK